MLEGVTETRAQLPSRHLKAELKELRENKELSMLLLLSSSEIYVTEGGAM